MGKVQVLANPLGDPSLRNFGGASFNQGDPKSHDSSYQSLNFTLTESNVTVPYHNASKEPPRSSRGLDTHRITATFFPIDRAAN